MTIQKKTEVKTFVSTSVSKNNMKKNLLNCSLCLELYQGLVSLELQIVFGLVLISRFLFASFFQVLRQTGNIVQSGVTYGSQIIYLCGLIHATIQCSDCIAGVTCQKLQKSKVVSTLSSIEFLGRFFVFTLFD